MGKLHVGGVVSYFSKIPPPMTMVTVYGAGDYGDPGRRERWDELLELESIVDERSYVFIQVGHKLVCWGC